MRYDIVSIVDILKPLHFLRSAIWKYFVTFWSIKKEWRGLEISVKMK